MHRIKWIRFIKCIHFQVWSKSEEAWNSCASLVWIIKIQPRKRLQMWTREAWMAMTWRDLAILSIGVATERMPTRWWKSSEDIYKILLKAYYRWMTLFVERKGKSRSVTWGEIVLALLQQFVTVITITTTTNTTITNTITINHDHNYHQSQCLGIRALWVEASRWWSTRRGWWEPLLLFPILRNYFSQVPLGDRDPERNSNYSYRYVDNIHWSWIDNMVFLRSTKEILNSKKKLLAQVKWCDHEVVFHINRTWKRTRLLSFQQDYLLLFSSMSPTLINIILI